MATLFQLFSVFFKIGLFTFGGGYAMISVIEDNCVERHRWITSDEMMNMTVIAESTPGPIAINCATFVGYRQRGILGAICATLGMILPSLIIIYLISVLLDNFLEIRVIASAFKGIKLAVGLLIVDAAIKMLKKMKKSVLSVSIMAVSLVAMVLIDIFALSFSSITLMLTAAVFSLIFFAVKSKREDDRK